MKYNTIIFDFDGTLCNTYEGIAYGFVKTLALFGVDSTNIDFNKHIGPPLEHSFKQLVGEDRYVEAVEKYREIFVGDNAHLMCKLYDGVVEMLEKLSGLGYTLCIATSKYQPFAIEAVERFGISKFFTHVYGQVGDRGNKTIVLRALIAENNLDVASCLMVGDTVYDVEGAHANNLDVLAVTYGFEPLANLEKAKPTAIVDSTTAVVDFITKQ